MELDKEFYETKAVKYMQLKILSWNIWIDGNFKEICEFLDISPLIFFPTGKSKNLKLSDRERYLATPEAIMIIDAMMAIKKPELRQKIINIAEVLAS